MTVSPSEDLCKRCGECCRVKIITFDRKRVVLDLFCPAFDLETKLCRIYEDRLWLLKEIVGDGCLKPGKMIAEGEAPESCGYAPPGYEAQSFDPDKLKLVAKWEYNWWRYRITVGRRKVTKWLKNNPKSRNQPRNSSQS